ncbi:Myb-like DNA-binding domain containing protein [Histomonas meleagridis]|uniref:Myb-like DNA-binding domain containing protein n=1 Tax=Histomonas meleagridis TaxID=135588 RepID=UPI0035598141|nr:Myb-like DNA-binding domain containing protein [Histomonas meleagridis]KAH0798606.1 Myb-like DNA-binding domain containing protein [Histomonas meleagridis]
METFPAPIAPTRKRKRNNAATKNNKWSDEEDELLRKIASSQTNIDWKLLKPQFPGKTTQQLFERWTKVLDPKLTKGSWTRQEDEFIINFVSKFGCKSWTKLATMLPGRVGKQCRERYMNHLNPNIHHGPWTPEEDRRLYALHESFGNHWTQIAKQMPTRGENMIKNRWYSVLSKKTPQEMKLTDNNNVPVQTIGTVVRSNEPLPIPILEDTSQNQPMHFGTSQMCVTGSPFALYTPNSKATPMLNHCDADNQKSLFSSPTKPKDSTSALSENKAEFLNLFVTNK